MPTSNSNTLYFTATSGVVGPIFIQAIKYIGASNGTALITAGTASGGVSLWEQAGTANWSDSEISIKNGRGVYITITNAAKVYIYLK